MTLFQFLLSIKANLRLDWDYHKQKWRASVPGAGYIMAAVTPGKGNALNATINYFGTKYLPYRAYGDSASWAVQKFVERVRGAKMMRANKIHIVPVDLSVSAFTDFPSVSGPDVVDEIAKETEVLYQSPAGAMAVETIPPGGLTYDEILAKTLPWPTQGPVTPDYPDVEESIPFPFKKQFKKKEPEPKPEPKKDKIDPFF